MANTLRYLGFSGFELVTSDGYRIVIDPFLSGSPVHGISPSPVQLSALDQTDLVLVSHGAFDHLGQALEIVRRSGALLGCGPDVRVHALAKGIPEERIVYLLSGCTLRSPNVVVKALDVRHVSLFESEGHWLSGQPLSFMVKVPDGPTIYHSGDTSLFGDLRFFGKLHQPDVALLCVGGVRVHGFEIVPLPADEAAIAVKWLGVRLAIPMHYLPNSDAPRRFMEHVAQSTEARVRVMSAGEVINLGALLKGDQQECD